MYNNIVFCLSRTYSCHNASLKKKPRLMGREECGPHCYTIPRGHVTAEYGK